MVKTYTFYRCAFFFPFFLIHLFMTVKFFPDSFIFFFPPWQRHHFAQAIAILNTQGCNIFDKFSRKVPSTQHLLVSVRTFIKLVCHILPTLGLPTHARFDEGNHSGHRPGSSPSHIQRSTEHGWWWVPDGGRWDRITINYFFYLLINCQSEPVFRDFVWFITNKHFITRSPIKVHFGVSVCCKWFFFFFLNILHPKLIQWKEPLPFQCTSTWGASHLLCFCMI